MTGVVSCYNIEKKFGEIAVSQNPRKIILTFCPCFIVCIISNFTSQGGLLNPFQCYTKNKTKQKKRTTPIKKSHESLAVMAL